MTYLSDNYSPPEVSGEQKATFSEFLRLIRTGEAEPALVVVNDIDTLEPVTVIAAVTRNDDGTMNVLPVGKMFKGDPDDEVIPPETPSKVLLQ